MLEIDQLVKKKNDTPQNALLAGILSSSVDYYDKHADLYRVNDIIDDAIALISNLSTSVKDKLLTKYAIGYRTRFAPQEPQSVFEPQSGTEYSIVHCEQSRCLPQSGEEVLSFNLDLYIAAINKISMTYDSQVGEESTNVESVPVVSSSSEKTNEKSNDMNQDVKTSNTNLDHMTCAVVGQVAGTSSGLSSRTLPSNFNSFGRSLANKNRNI